MDGKDSRNILLILLSIWDVWHLIYLAEKNANVDTLEVLLAHNANPNFADKVSAGATVGGWGLPPTPNFDERKSRNGRSAP